MASINMVAWTYTARDGTTYTRRADSRLTAQQGDNAPLGAIGGTAATGATLEREMPRNLKPRVALVKEVGASFRTNLVIYSEAALAALVVGTTTFVIYDRNGVQHTCLVQGRKDEPLTGAIKA